MIIRRFLRLFRIYSQYLNWLGFNLEKISLKSRNFEFLQAKNPCIKNPTVSSFEDIVHLTAIYGDFCAIYRVQM